MHQSRALVVHRDPHKRELFRALFRTQGFEAFMAQEGHQALNLALESLPHVALISDDLEDLGGMEVCEKLSAHRERYGIELVVLLSREQFDSTHEDILVVEDSLDFRPIRKIISDYRKLRILSEIAGEDITRESDLEKFLGNLKDPLTGVCHHEYMRIRAEEEQKRSERYGIDLSLLTIDTVNFDRIRERQGRMAANEVLLWLSGVLLLETRDVDLIARIPESKFEVLLPNTSSQGAEVLANRLRPQFEAAPVTWSEDLEPQVKISVRTLVQPTE